MLLCGVFADYHSLFHCSQALTFTKLVNILSMAFSADTNISYHHETHRHSDPRAELSSYYELSGELPTSISNRVFKKQTSHGSVNDELYDNDRKIITQMLHDSRISVAQRETIATSILSGNYQVSANEQVSPSRSSIHRTEKEMSTTRSNFIDLNRHNLRKPNFLEVISESTRIPIVSPKEVYEQKITHIRSKGSGHQPNIEARTTKPKVMSDRTRAVKELQSKALAEDKMYAQHEHLFCIYCD